MPPGSALAETLRTCTYIPHPDTPHTGLLSFHIATNGFRKTWGTLLDGPMIIGLRSSESDGRIAAIRLHQASCIFEKPFPSHVEAQIVPHNNVKPYRLEFVKRQQLSFTHTHAESSLADD